MGSFGQHFILFSIMFIEEMKRGNFIQVGNIRDPAVLEGVRVVSLICKLYKQKAIGKALVEWSASFGFSYCGFKSYCSAQDVPAFHLAPSSPNMLMLGVKLFLQNIPCRPGLMIIIYHRNARWYMSLINLFSLLTQNPYYKLDFNSL